MPVYSAADCLFFFFLCVWGAGMGIKNQSLSLQTYIIHQDGRGKKNDDAIHLSNGVLYRESLQIYSFSLGAFKECGWRQMQRPNLFGR